MDLLWLVGVAGVFRLAFLAALPRVVDSADAIHYIGVARVFCSGSLSGFDLSIPILYPALCALAHLLVPDIEWACRAVSLFSSCLLPIPVYLIARALHGRQSARVAGGTVCLWPWVADYGCRVAPEALAVTLWFGAVYALARALRDGRGWLVAAPVLFFALHLVRPEGTFLLLAAPVGGLLCLGHERRHVHRLVPYVLVAGGLLVLYVLFMRWATGLAALNPRMRDPGETAQFLLAHLGAIGRTAWATWGRVIPTMLGPYLLVFAGIGLFGQGESRRDFRLEALLVFFAAVQWGVSILSTYAEPRYLMSVVIALSIWAARGMALVGLRAAGLPRHRWLRFVPVVGMVAMMLAGAVVAVVPSHLGGLPKMPYEYKIAGRWMKENLPEGLILTRKPQVGFYAEMPTSGPAPDDDPEGLVERARRIQARYVVLDERYTAKLAPNLAPLLDPACAPDGLRLIRDDLSPYPGGRIVVYEVVCGSPRAL